METVAEKRAAVIRFNELMGFIDDDDDLVLKHIELPELLAVIEELAVNPDTKDRAGAQYDKWHNEFQDIIADDPDADLSGFDDEDDEDWDEEDESDHCPKCGESMDDLFHCHSCGYEARECRDLDCAGPMEYDNDVCPWCGLSEDTGKIEPMI